MMAYAKSEMQLLAEMVPPMQQLQELDLSGNPVSTASRMRQNVLLWGPALQVLDDKEVLAPSQTNQSNQSAVTRMTRQVLVSERAFLAHLERRLEHEGHQQQMEQMEQMAPEVDDLLVYT